MNLFEGKRLETAGMENEIRITIFMLGGQRMRQSWAMKVTIREHANNIHYITNLKYIFFGQALEAWKKTYMVLVSFILRMWLSIFIWLWLWNPKHWRDNVWEEREVIFHFFEGFKLGYYRYWYVIEVVFIF